MKNRIKNMYLKIRNYAYIQSKEHHFCKATVTFTHVTHCIGGNIGDTVLSMCVRDLFQCAMGIQKWKIVTVNRPVSQCVVNRINTASAVIIGGGGLFLPDTNPNAISGWIWAASKKQVTSIQPPIFIFSVGYNYFHGQEAAKLFQENIGHLIKKASFVGLRNHGSIRVVRRLLEPGLRGKVVYQPCPTTLIRKLYPGLPPKKGQNVVAVNMAFDRKELRFGEQEEVILKQAAAAIKDIEARGYRIVYVAHYEPDMGFIQYLKMAKVHFSVKNLSNKHPWKAILFYNSVGLVLGMRGHAQMIPFGLNCEILSLGTHDKLKWFLEDIDALDWYIELAKDPGTLRKRILDAFIKIHETDAKLTQARLRQQQEKLWEITLRNMKKIRYIATQQTRQQGLEKEGRYR